MGEGGRGKGEGGISVDVCLTSNFILNMASNADTELHCINYFVTDCNLLIGHKQTTFTPKI